MGLVPPEIHPVAPRQTGPPAAPPSGAGISGDDALTVDPNQASAAPTLAIDTSVPAGEGFSTAPGLVPSYTPVVTISPTATPDPSPTSDSSDASATVAAASNSSRPISMSTVIGSCVGAFIGAAALIALGFWFYRRYQRSLKAAYRSRGRGPLNTRADLHRRLSHREHWGKLEDTTPEDKWEGRAKAATDESIPPMEKLTMFKKAPSVRTAYTHTEEEPVHFDIPHPFAQQYSLYSSTQASPENNAGHYSSNPSIPITKPFMAHDTSAPVLPWDDAQGSFLSVRTQSESLSGSMSPSLSMAIPTPPATSSPLHRWESAEIINFEGQSAEIVNNNPFGDENTAGERRKSGGNPFFGAHESVPRRRSRSNSIASKASRASRPRSDTSSVYVPVPRLDKGKGRAIDPFDDDHTPVPPAPTSTPASSAPSFPSTPLPTISTSVPTVTINTLSPNPTSPGAPLPPPRPAFATHAATLSASSVSSNEHALALLLAALEGDATEEEVQARLRIASMQPSINSTSSMYSEVDEDDERDVTKDFPLPPLSTSGRTTPTPTIDSYVTAESDRTVRT